MFIILRLIFYFNNKFIHYNLFVYEDVATLKRWKYLNNNIIFAYTHMIIDLCAVWISANETKLIHRMSTLL